MDEDDVRDVRETTNRLAGRLVEPRGLLKTELRYMEVVQVSGVTVTLKAGQAFDPQEGAVVDVLFGPGVESIASPTPRVGDQVAVLRNRSDYVVAGIVGVPSYVKGIFTATTDVNGFITNVAHGAPFTPSDITLIKRGTGAGANVFWSGGVDTITATTFRARCLDNAGGAVNTTSVTVPFVCYP